MVRSENKQEEKSMQDKHYLDDWIHVPICQKGDKLYHYTTAEGIRGIVENREFVATKSDFLNDFNMPLR